MKFCSKCDTNKILTDFNPRGDGPGLRAHCKKCCSKANLARKRLLNPPRKVMTKEERHLANLASYKRHNAKSERKAKQAFYEATRRSRKLKATPKWLTKEQLDHIEFYYACARAWTEQFDQQLDIDHIIPLKGKQVCGLHVPWNLQIMSHEANLLKTNKLE